ncbi:uncharacterized protein LOC130237344 [Danio aesculapii]|uniref:uncharacterized protein LOC130237344 n=1 Tax=Danio aesculapii TaxID=1142201 RepID=UPI0024BF695A|nr:uncharacterized protein LOC130237344 [Danio aesculapii]
MVLRAGVDVIIMDNMSRASHITEPESEVCHKRVPKPPRHLADFEVEYSGFQHTYPPASKVQHELYQRESEWQGAHYQSEGAAGMTPFIQCSENERDGEPYEDKEAQAVIQRLREENVQLYRTLREMSQRVDTGTTVLQSPIPLPRTKPVIGASSTQAKFTPIPAPRSHRSFRLNSNKPAAKEAEVCEPVVDDQVSVSAISNELSRMSIRSLPENIHVPYHHSSPYYAQPQPDTRAYPVHNQDDYCSYGPNQPQMTYRATQPVLMPHKQLERIQPHNPIRNFVSAGRPPPARESTYRGPTPSIPDFTSEDPRQFARLKISLENLLPQDATEQFKYQILVEHLKVEEALLIADSYSNSPYPYSYTMQSLTEHYGQPHQLALQRIAELMEGPNMRSGDTQAFRRFALRVRALVGMLDQLGDKGSIELQCGSHVARLMSKLPHDLRANFKRYIHPLRNPIPNLLDFSDWLEFELQVQPTDSRVHLSELKGRSAPYKEAQRPRKHPQQPTAILHSTDQSLSSTTTKEPEKETFNRSVYCQYCDNKQHFLNQCCNFAQLPSELKANWIKINKRCWKCGGRHQAAQCKLKAACKVCTGKHLTTLHEVNSRSAAAKSPEVQQESQTLYLDRPVGGSQVLLKISKVLLHNGKHTLTTYAILDDGSERTILLHEAAQQLKINGEPENLALRTVRHDTQVLSGAKVSFTLSPASQPNKKFKIRGAFTANHLGLAKHSHPVQALQEKFNHLKSLPLHSFSQVQPLLLIGSDHHHLIAPIEPVRFGPPGGPAGVKTRLGWTLQGPANVVQHQLSAQQCLFTSVVSSSELLQNVERLWKIDTLPYRTEKEVTRSRCDQDAINLLESKTVRVDVDGVSRYATPLLRKKEMPMLQAPKEAVLPQLRGLEKRLGRNQEWARSYNQEIDRLEKAGYVIKLKPEAVDQSQESWYIPHHMVCHNGKNRVVYNCSFRFEGHNLNEYLLPGPTLTSTLLGILLRFREHTVAVTSDIKGMFHQIRLLPEDKPLLRFLWRNIQRESPVNVYEWQVLPFGTTCSPCCATFAVLKHTRDHTSPDEDARMSVERHFYVDNFLQSVPSEDKATKLVNKLQSLLASGGFELRQWASNIPSVVAHLPLEARSEKNELWLSEKQWNVAESTLGLRWLCQTDTLGYKAWQRERQVPTLRYIYHVLASQYDPLGYIVPYTTRAKVLIQRLWDKSRDWDDPKLPNDLQQAWCTWEEELQNIERIVIPRCYTSPPLDAETCVRDIHIFCDASESAYGSVAYLRTQHTEGQVEVSFIAARSRVAPKRQLSIPRLELCAALTGAQLASLLERELTLPIQHLTLWSDSKVVLTWIQSESCRYKVFVGTRIAEIQELTSPQAWKYVKSEDNPADDITRGKSLWQLAQPTRWNLGPHFLRQDPLTWPNDSVKPNTDNTDEETKISFCGLTRIDFSQAIQGFSQFHSLSQAVESKALEQFGLDKKPEDLSAKDYAEAEITLLKEAQATCFPTELEALTTGKPLPSNSRLLTLAPELDKSTGLIRVGGRLRRSELLDPETVHPIILEPKHPLSQLLIQHFDEKLHHPGPERVYAEIRRQYWILRGREAVRYHQHKCTECRKWRGKPEIPRMADLPPARLRLYKPAFYSTGVDCFGPFIIKVGRRNEKRWGIIFKCMTTRAVYIDVLTNISSDSFLMALRRFIARRGKPHELFSDQGTNFKGGEREITEAFNNLQPTLKSQLAKQQIEFHFNPPGAPHFGGIWEREIRTLKAALNQTLGAQHVSEEVLTTVLVEIEGILNSKPLGYVPSDVADIDPITPNSLLMGRPDSSLPQVVYPKTELLSKKQWRHSQILADHFWAHFIKRYLPQLQTREKWMTDKAKNLEKGTVVIIIDSQLPRALWLVGKITDTIPGADGCIRTAEVQVGDRKYVRPVSKLIRLPPLPEDDNS